MFMAYKVSKSVLPADHAPLNILILILILNTARRRRGTCAYQHGQKAVWKCAYQHGQKAVWKCAYQHGQKAVWNMCLSTRPEGGVENVPINTARRRFPCLLSSGEAGASSISMLLSVHRDHKDC